MNETLAHNDGSSLLARTGHHNDCFLASSTDYGTYLDKTIEYPYLIIDTRYTAMGGETCNYNPPRSNCPTALEELKMFSWTYLNSEYEPNVLGMFVLHLLKFSLVPDVLLSSHTAINDSFFQTIYNIHSFMGKY